ncbi:MAG: DUF1405 domain-containing protein [Candidatus Micrarchaeota archaeon]
MSAGNENRKTLFGIVLAANLLGAAYGILGFYLQQLLSTNVLLWIFVPDCPLYALTFAIAIILIKEGKRYDWFYFIALVGALKYGFWTVFVLLRYPEFYFAPEISLIYYTLLFAHVGMFLEAFTLLGKIKMRNWFLPLALGWFLLNDFADYFLGAHPPLPVYGLGFMWRASVVMSVAFSVFGFALAKRAKKPLVEIFG